MVHVYPGDDLIEHRLEDINCICGPKVEWTDTDTGELLESGPLVGHHSLDGREHREPDEIHPGGWTVALIA